MQQLRSSLTSLSWLIKMIILFICYHNLTTFSYHNYQLFKFHYHRYHYHPYYHQHHPFSFMLRLNQHSNYDYNTHHSRQKLSHRYHLSSLSSSSSKTTSSSSFQLYQSISPSDEIIDPAIYSSDLYEVLGLLRNASKAQIKDAYWSIASRNHPDR